MATVTAKVREDLFEIWKAVEGYEGLYEVSDSGRVRSLDRHIATIRGSRLCKGRILRPIKNNTGYYQVILAKNGRARHFLVHRLVAAAFCEHPEGCDVVNHIDNNPSNNNCTNLEYTTHKGNTFHAIMENRMIARPVIRSDGKYYPMMSMVKQDGFRASAVVKCCNGEQRMHKGFGWNYACLFENGPYGKTRRFRLVPESCALPHRNEKQNIQSEDVKKLRNKANIRVPELGMQAVFIPTIHGAIDKREPTPPARGRVTYINRRNRIFTVEYQVYPGKLRETFKFVDIGSSIRLYKD